MKPPAPYLKSLRNSLSTFFTNLRSEPFILNRPRVGGLTGAVAGAAAGAVTGAAAMGAATAAGAAAGAATTGATAATGAGAGARVGIFVGALVGTVIWPDVGGATRTAAAAKARAGPIFTVEDIY